MKREATIDAATIDEVRQAFERSKREYGHIGLTKVLHETFADFVSDDPNDDESRVRSPADAAACFPELNRTTVSEGWSRAVRVWRGETVPNMITETP